MMIRLEGVAAWDGYIPRDHPDALALYEIARKLGVDRIALTRDDGTPLDGWGVLDDD
jgi:hypothetical protein